jgi:hypothetical protein
MQQIQKSSETTEQKTKGFSVLSTAHYIQRYKNVHKMVHQQLAAKGMELLASDVPTYKHQTTEALGSLFKLYWDREIQTDKRRPTAATCFVTKSKGKTEVGITEIAVPLNYNLRTINASKFITYSRAG